ncbi:uncharacterized protein LOC143536661 [Bidens hawaiensis]|uniref:uncharacterized protein LOC143536661 n=1 Tax=Bidens hawaiensis TaxID=980011 RepID=UPI00404AB10D
METANYTSWSELFKIHYQVFLVYDHLSPRITPQSSSTAPPTGDKPPLVEDNWDQLDAIVLQWIYGTISNDLLQTILKKDTHACDAWLALENLFQDNKTTRATLLKQQFTSTRLDGFKDMSSYCQALKVIADQLANVDARSIMTH